MKAQKGDLIRVIDVQEPKDKRINVGDIFEVAIACDNGDVYIDTNGDTPIWLVDEEYEVIDTKKDFENDYYAHMPEDFRAAVNVIKQYCQFEDCIDSYCDKCPYPLKTIRCGDE